MKACFIILRKYYIHEAEICKVKKIIARFDMKFTLQIQVYGRLKHVIYTQIDNKDDFCF